MPVYLDCETYSAEPIKNGHFRYSEDCEILMVAWAVDDAAPEIWDSKREKHMPAALRDVLRGDDILIAHNAAFEQAVFAADLVGVTIDPKRWRCSMAKAYAHGLPGSLESLSTILGLPQDQKKSKEGYDLVRLFCVPPPKNSKRGRATYETHPVQWEKLKAYCKQDIVAAREVWKKLPEWNYKGFELDLWHLDQKINQRGICIDLDLAKAAIRAVDREQKILKSRTEDLTLGDVSSATKRDAMLEHILAAYGVDLPDMQASTSERRIEDPDLPEGLRELLAIRLQATTSSTAKYKKVMACVSSDGRLRGTLQFCGAARTGRWSGRLFQPQNLAKPPSGYDVNMGIEALKADCTDILYDNVMEVASNSCRGLIVASEGKKLIVSDLSNVEGRYAAWVAGEEWKLQAFRDYDTVVGEDEKGKPLRKGHDLYKLTCAKTLRIRPEEVTKKQRDELGKTMELALGFAGGVGAFVTFATNFNIDLEALARNARDSIPADVLLEAEDFWKWCEAEKRTLGLERNVFIVCDSFKRMWRRANPCIVAMWENLANGVIDAIETKNTTIDMEPFKIRRDGNWLRIQMPSGRSLCYPHPQVGSKGEISFMGVEQYTRKWSRIKTFGGKLFENAVQGGARDVMAWNMPLIENAGFEIVLTAHDEIVCEYGDRKGQKPTRYTDENTNDAPSLSALLSMVPAWAEGLPLAASGYSAYRYRKDG